MVPREKLVHLKVKQTLPLAAVKVLGTRMTAAELRSKGPAHMSFVAAPVELVSDAGTQG